MGAAAFLMIEFVGISYIEVIKHAFLPAIIAYIALVYIVYLESCKAGLVGITEECKENLYTEFIDFQYSCDWNLDSVDGDVLWIWLAERCGW